MDIRMCENWLTKQACIYFTVITRILPEPALACALWKALTPLYTPLEENQPSLNHAASMVK